MKKIDPKIFAAGIGAASGAYLMSTNNDPLAIASGALVGAATGLAGNYTLPNVETMLSVNQGLSLPKQATSTSTLQRIREEILSRANVINQTSASEYSGAFDIKQPFSTLNESNYSQLSDAVYNTNDIIELRRISNSLAQRTDKIGLNLSAVNLGITQSNRSIKIDEYASETSREKAFKYYLKNNLGLTDDKDIQSKYEKFQTLINRSGSHYINDNTLYISGLEPINLYGTVGQGNNKVNAHISNNNVYVSSDFNLFGRSMLQGEKNVDAIAKALGLEMADAFNLQELLNTTNGMSSDDVIAMLSNSKKVTDESLNEVITELNKRKKYDANLTGQYISSDMQRDKINPLAFHRNIQGRTDFELSLNIDRDSGELNLKNPVKKLSNTSTKGEISEVTRLGRHIALNNPSFNTKEGVKPDYSTEYVNSKFDRKMINLETPANRNSAASVRGHKATTSQKTTLQEIADRLIQDLGIDMQYGDSIVMPRYSVDINKYNPIAAEILGSDVALADGFSISNREVTKKFNISETRKIDFNPDVEGNYNILDNDTIKNILKGNLKLEDANAIIDKFQLGTGYAEIERLTQHLERTEKSNPRYGIIEDQLKTLQKEEQLASIYHDDLRFTSSQLLGYTPEGLEIKTGRDMDNFKLASIHMIAKNEGHPILQLGLEGNINLGDQTISKLFGVDSKTQIRNIDQELFVKSGLIADLINREKLDFVDGNIISTNMPEKDLKSLFKKDVNTILKHDLFNSENEYYENLTRALKSEIGIITDSGDSGQKAFKSLQNALISNTNNIMNDSLFDLLQTSYQEDNKRLTSLSKLGVALTSNKSSSSVLMESLIFNQNLGLNKLNDLKQSIFTNSVQNELTDVLDYMKSININLDFKDVMSLSGTNNKNLLNSKFDAITTQFKTNYSSYAQDVVKYFNDPVLKLNTLEVNPSKYLEFLHLFPSQELENISLSISSPDLKLESVLGSGTTNKNMSHNAQLQLLYSGLTQEDLSLLGHHNTAKVIDLHSMLALSNLAEDSINSQIEKLEPETLRRAINTTSGNRRETLKRLGVEITGSYGQYNLSSEYNGLKSISIPLEDSSSFASFYNQKTDSFTNPKTIGLIGEVISLDQRLQRSQSITEKEIIQERLNNAIEHYSNNIKKHLFSESNPLVKASLRLESERSLSSNITATAGLIDRFIDARGKEGLHQSFSEVTVAGALKRLRESGIRVKNEEELINKYTEVISSGGVNVRRLKASANQPFFSVLSREPATGPGSLRMMEYLINDSNLDDESLRISWRDKLYAKLQFGDHDADHGTEFFPDFKNTNTAKLYQKLIPLTEELSNLQLYGDELGIKGKNNSYMKSLVDLFTGDYERNVGEFFQNYQLENEQAGLRKRVAPAATMLAASLNNSIEQLGLGMIEKNEARLLSHYTVENLIKSAHADSSTFETGKTKIEELYSLRKQYINNQDPSNNYFKEMKSFLTDMLNPDASQTVKDIHNRAIDNLIKAEEIYATNEMINPMEQGLSKHKPLVEALDDSRKVVTGENAAISTIATENISTPVDTRVKKGYNEISKTIQRNLIENKKVLAIGGGALLATALLTQKQPDFSGTKAEANPSAMMMRPMSDTVSESSSTTKHIIEGMNLNRATDYILPETLQKQSATVDGKYIGNNYRQSMKTSIFGDNIDTARIETY